MRGYRQIWLKHLSAHFGDMTLRQYTPDLGTVLLDGLTAKASQATLRHTALAYKWQVTFSAGVVTFKTPPATADYKIEAAEKLMRVAKDMDKNRVSYLGRDC
jgi:PleD family two-component response regulator